MTSDRRCCCWSALPSWAISDRSGKVAQPSPAASSTQLSSTQLGHTAQFQALMHSAQLSSRHSAATLSSAPGSGLLQTRHSSAQFRPAPAQFHSAPAQFRSAPTQFRSAPAQFRSAESPATNLPSDGQHSGQLRSANLRLSSQLESSPLGSGQVRSGQPRSTDGHKQADGSAQVTDRQTDQPRSQTGRRVNPGHRQADGPAQVTDRQTDQPRSQTGRRTRHSHWFSRPSRGAGSGRRVRSPVTDWSTSGARLPRLGSTRLGSAPDEYRPAAAAAVAAGRCCRPVHHVLIPPLPPSPCFVCAARGSRSRSAPAGRAISGPGRPAVTQGAELVEPVITAIRGIHVSRSHGVTARPYWISRCMTN